MVYCFSEVFIWEAKNLSGTVANLRRGTAHMIHKTDNTKEKEIPVAGEVVLTLYFFAPYPFHLANMKQSI